MFGSKKNENPFTNIMRPNTDGYSDFKKALVGKSEKIVPTITEDEYIIF